MPPEFNAKTIATLSKRVAHRCSNIDCGKLTVGPNTERTKSTSIGEAAHIYGAQPGSARYRAQMTDAERATVTNAIWLCSDCHRWIDRDPARFPADLLLHWKSRQEEVTLRQFGKSGELLRFELAQSEGFKMGDIPIFIRQVIENKADYWEYTATAELLDFYLKEPMQRASQLKKGLYTRPKRNLEMAEFQVWVATKIDELGDEVECLKKLLPELMATWGQPGEAGIPHDMVDACRLYGRCAQRFVDIAEEAMFARPPKEFESIGRHLAIAALYAIERLPEVSVFLRLTFAKPNPKGNFTHQVVIELPDGWAEEFNRLMEIGMEKFDNNNQY